VPTGYRCFCWVVNLRDVKNNVRAWVAAELQPQFVTVCDAGWATLGWLKGY